MPEQLESASPEVATRHAVDLGHPACARLPMAKVTDSSDPMITAKRMAFWSEAEPQTAPEATSKCLGKLCRLTSSPPIVSSRNLLLATPSPQNHAGHDRNRVTDQHPTHTDGDGNPVAMSEKP